jgi:hypothetical protein
LKSNSLDFPNVTRMQRDFLHLHFFFRFILKRIFGYTLKCSIHIETFFCRSLKVGYVSLSSTPCLCFLLRNLKLIKWRQWGIFYSRDQHESGTFPPQHFRKCTFYEMFSNVRKMHVMKREESSYHSTIASINIYLVPQHNKWEVFRVRWTCLQISTQDIISSNCLQTIKRSV